MIIRQGDILLVSTDEKPQEKRTKRDKGRLVLAYGESTGHSHAIAEPKAKGYGEVQVNWIECPVPFEIRHEEHATVSVPAGTYKVIRQSEYRRKEIVRVVD